MADRVEINDTVSFAQPDGTLRVLPGAQVSVTSPGGSPLTVYAAESGPETVTPHGDAFGRIEGWVQTADFDLHVSGAGVSYTQHIRQITGGGGGGDGGGGSGTDVRENGAVMDGVADDFSALQQTIDDVHSEGGGFVNLGRGIAGISQPPILKDDVILIGEGVGATSIRVLDGAGCRILETEGWADLVGTDVPEGPRRFGIHGITLDGNAAGNGGFSEGLVIYGCEYELKGFEIRDTRGPALRSEWYLGGDRMEAQVSDFKIVNSRSHGLWWKGPHDSVIEGGQVIRAGTGGAGGASGVLVQGGGEATTFEAVHSWGDDQANAWYHAADGCQLVGCQGEGGFTRQLVLNSSDNTVMGGAWFGVGGTGDASAGLTLGLDGSTPSRNFVATTIRNCFKSVERFASGGRSIYQLVCTPADNPASQVYVGTPHESDRTTISVDSVNSADWIKDQFSVGGGRVDHYVPEHVNAARLIRDDTGDNLVRVETNVTPARFYVAATDVHGFAAGAGSPSWTLLASGALVLSERAAEPPNPSSDGACLYTRDNGSGKTQVMARFANGSLAQVAIQP